MDICYKPWELNPDLTENRLTLIAQLLADTRSKALESFDPEEGDGKWSHGCITYERCRNKLIEKTTSGEWPWLSISNTASLACPMKIGETILRFYKGSSSNPSMRTLVQGHNDIHQLSFDFGSEMPAALFWRIAIETSPDGEVISTTCIGVTEEGTIACTWAAPLKPYIPILSPINANYAEAVELPEPTVELPNYIMDAARGNE